MCQSILSAVSMLNPSATLLDTLASSLAAVFNPYEIQSVQGISACMSLLSSITSLAESGYMVDAEDSTRLTIANILSNFAILSSLTQLTVPALSNIGAAVDSLSKGVLSTMTAGQSAVNLQTANLHMKMVFSLVTDLQGTTLLPPSSSEYSTNSPQITLPVSGLEVCKQTGHYLKLSVSSWGLNPYSSSGNITTPLLRLKNLN